KWDKLLSPTELAELKADLHGEMVGLGIQISLDESSGFINIDGVIPGSAAAKAGLIAGDKILRVDGKPVRGPDSRSVPRGLRGRAGSAATLTVLGDAQVLPRTVRRAAFVFEPVTRLMLPGGVALVQIRTFSEKTPVLLERVLGEARSDGAKALVLD